MPDIDLHPLSQTIKQHGLNAKKSLGQHFLTDLNITRKIVRAAGDLSGKAVIEIGPGPGGLTRALAESDAAEIIVIEKDPRCLPVMEEIRAQQPRLKIIEGDALSLKLQDLTDLPIKVVANLPYNISTPLMTRWLADVTRIESLTLMFQKEVVDRLKAQPNTKQYGRLSVLTQWLCDVTPDFDLPPEAFVPPPKVYSTVVTLAPRQKPKFPANAEVLQKVVKAAFGQRRKMLRASLKGTLDNPAETLQKIGIDPTRRAESLSVEEFCILANSLNA